MEKWLAFLFRLLHYRSKSEIRNGCMSVYSLDSPLLDEVNLNTIISPDDIMMHQGCEIETYMKVSISGLSTILKTLHDNNLSCESIKSILDFGCGYGRIYRSISAAFPSAQLTACDLIADAAKFCAETFGGDWIQSNENLEEIDLPRLYDLVWLGSVFTHLPENRWHNLLSFLAKYTNKNGLVIFTTHGNRAINVIENGMMKRNPHAIDKNVFENMKNSLSEKNFIFIPNKQAAIQHAHRKGMGVSDGEYGFSFTSKAWIETLFLESLQWKLVNYLEEGWGNNHDVVVIRRISV